jgi:hypothetical protein
MLDSLGLDWWTLYFALGFGVFCYLVARTITHERERILANLREKLGLVAAGIDVRIAYAVVDSALKQITWWSVVFTFLLTLTACLFLWPIVIFIPISHNLERRRRKRAEEAWKNRYENY